MAKIEQTVSNSQVSWLVTAGIHTNVLTETCSQFFPLFLVCALISDCTERVCARAVKFSSSQAFGAEHMTIENVFGDNTDFFKASEHDVPAF